MALTVSWTKAWSNSDNGTILFGADLGNLQSDIQTALAGGAGLNAINTWAALQTFNAGVKPTHIILPVQGSGPTTAADQGAVYVKTVNSVDELFYRMESNGTEVQITRNGYTDAAFLHVRDEKAANTAGGTFTSGAWRTRTLNTVKTNQISGASLASNQITLPSGTYRIIGYSIGFRTLASKIRLRNITDSTDDIVGMTGDSDSVSGGNIPVFLIGEFTIAAQKVFEVQHYAENTNATGFGRLANLDSKVEVYSDIQIWKVA